MKINLILDNKILSTKINKHIKVKDIIRNLKNQKMNQIFEKETDYDIFDENLSLLSADTQINYKENFEKNLFVVVPVEKFESGENETKSEEIDELITKVTGAKTKFKSIKQQPTRRPFDIRLQLIEQMANSINSLGTVTTENPMLQGRVNEINQFSQLLRNMINDDLILGNLGNVEFNTNTNSSNSQNRNTATQVLPDENLLKNLKEMGFPEDKCRTALIMSKNNITRATDILINDELDYMVDEG